jgi:hypothetical protein
MSGLRKQCSSENVSLLLSFRFFEFWQDVLVAVLSVDCDECRWNYIAKDDVVAGSSPASSNMRGCSSVVEHVNRFINFVVAIPFFATNAWGTT